MVDEKPIMVLGKGSSGADAQFVGLRANINNWTDTPLRAWRES